MIRLALSYVFYGLGYCAYLFCNSWPGAYFEWPYSLYSRLMTWSSKLQGDDKRGPWVEDTDVGNDQ